MRGYPFAPLDRSPSPVFSPLYLQALLSSVLRLSWPRRRLQRARRRSGRQRSCARSPGRRKSVPLGRRRSRAARRRRYTAHHPPAAAGAPPPPLPSRCSQLYPPSRALLSLDTPLHLVLPCRPLGPASCRLQAAALAGAPPSACCRHAAGASARPMQEPRQGFEDRCRWPLLIVLLLVVGFALK